jgi:hypothetical protein
VQVPDGPLTLSKTQAATRQVETAIEAIERGDFDVATTLAGAAEGMLDRPGHHLFDYLLNHPKVRHLDRKKEWIPVLNRERDWLKHAGPPGHMEIGRYAACSMIARAATKLEVWTPSIVAFGDWYVENIEQLAR